MKEIHVKEYMNSKGLVLKYNTPMQEAVDLLFDHQASGAPVINEQKEVVGFISEKDCIAKVLSSVYHGEPAPTVNEVMVEDVVTVSVNDNIFDVAQMMISTTPKLYPVVNSENKYVGVLSRTNVLKALVGTVENCFGN